MFIRGRIAVLHKAKGRILSVLNSAVEYFQDIQFESTNDHFPNDDEYPDDNVFDPQDYIIMSSDSDTNSDDSSTLTLINV